MPFAFSPWSIVLLLVRETFGLCRTCHRRRRWSGMTECGRCLSRRHALEKRPL